MIITKKIENAFFYDRIEDHKISLIKFKNGKILKDINDTEYIKKYIKNIIYIKYIRDECDFISTERYFKLLQLHNLDDAALINKNKNFPSTKFYYLNDKELSYIEWLNHPEKIRYDRNNNLKLI